jgi:phosphohistidine phosphatase
MKTIYFVRHAKASWDFPELSDIQRPLLDVGKKRTKKIIKFLLEKGIVPALILSSPAVRAFETAKLLAAGLHYPEDTIKIAKSIYHGDVEHILNDIFALPNTTSSVMIVGHNPVITNLVNMFTNPAVDILPTSGLVGISFETDQWEMVPQAARKTEFIVYPKML